MDYLVSKVESALFLTLIAINHESLEHTRGYI